MKELLKEMGGEFKEVYLTLGTYERAWQKRVV